MVEPHKVRTGFVLELFPRGQSAPYECSECSCSKWLVVDIIQDYIERTFWGEGGMEIEVWCKNCTYSCSGKVAFSNAIIVDKYIIGQSWYLLWEVK